ncbi:hypothetical protein [uncultured Thermomonospora sp.]|jgi:S-DNA-T family DNA segregation ATPase FtsK/SpoIIIE|uniref:hypothetical protein n=1 Tax=uncultured Thermomonospora sp. TaxID=671175 RepID=UPI00259B6126|nr:hypothetical protein [uncultured Thermomonospora sp.]
MTDLWVWGLLAPASVAVGLWVWQRMHPVSFWYLVGFPLRMLMIYGTWRSVASGCGLSRRKRRWRWTFPGLGG